jgi:glucose-6-phosphate isomerase
LTARPLSIPVALGVSAAGLAGRSDNYEVFLPRLAGVYNDTEDFERQLDERGTAELVYTVDVHSYDSGPGSLTIGTSTLLPGKVGDEFAVTRGHLHALADRAELYYCLAGRGVMLMDTLEGETRAIELTPGVAAHVPGRWIHRSVNVGDEPFVTLFCYNGDAGQNYEVIADAGGMKTLVVDDGRGGWAAIENPRHTGYALDPAAD